MVENPKSLLRTQIRAIAAGMSPEEQTRADVAICEALMSLLGSVAGPTTGPVLGFVPSASLSPPEPAIGPVLDHLAKAKRLALAGMDWERKALLPALVTDPGSQLVPGRLGILVPATRCPAIEPTDLAAVLVPGVAFDKMGGRLGRGAGLYDRFLTLAKRPDGRPLKIGVAFHCQLVDSVPVDRHDCPVDLLVTDAGVIDCRQGRARA